MANRLYTSQFSYSFEKRLVELLGKFTLDVAGARASLVDQGITYTAVAFGAAGNDVSIELLDPADINKALAITVTGSAISVSLATDGAGVITTDISTLVAAIQADVDASALVTVAGSGLTVLAALVATPLAGGVDAVFSDNLSIAYMSVSQKQEGIYEVLLADKYIALLSISMMLQTAAASAVSLQMKSEDVSNTKAIDFRAVDSSSGTAVLADLIVGDVIYMDIKLRDVR